MTTRTTTMSGTFKQLPKLLPYPKTYPYVQVSEHLKQHLCYLLRFPWVTGLSVLITRKNDTVAVLCGDWSGNVLDLQIAGPLVERALAFLKTDLSVFLHTMQLIKLPQAQFFFGLDEDRLVLTDIQLSLNKLVGPGMVRDIFGSVYAVPEVLKIEIIDGRVDECLRAGTGSYGGDVLIKPSKFSLFSPTRTEIVPLYARV